MAEANQVFCVLVGRAITAKLLLRSNWHPILLNQGVEEPVCWDERVLVADSSVRCLAIDGGYRAPQKRNGETVVIAELGWTGR